MFALHPCFSNVARTLIGVIISVSCFSQASTVQLKHLTIEDGLSSSMVNCMLQDSKGFMWFGTDNGLDRYDGYQLKTYKHNLENSLGLGQSSILSLLEDRKGILWIGTDKGLEQFDRTTEFFTRYIQEETNPFDPNSNIVFSLCEDRDGRLWVGTFKGLFLFQKETGKYVKPHNDPDNPNNLSNIAILTIYKSRDGKLWIGTFHGLYHFDPATEKVLRVFKKSKNLAPSATIDHNLVLKIAEDRSGLLFIQTLAGLNLYDPKNAQEPFKHFPQFEPSTVQRRHDGTIIFVTRSRLYRQLQPGSASTETYHFPAPLSVGVGSQTINELLEDREGTIWIGTDNGIYFLPPESLQFTQYKIHTEDASSLNTNLPPQRVFVSRDGSVWISTRGGGVNRIDPVSGNIQRYRYRNFDNPYSIDYNEISCIYEDHLGIMWFGLAGGGINRLDPRTGLFSRCKPNEGGDLISLFYEDKDSILWVGHSGGVSRFDKASQNFEFSSYAPELIRKPGIGIVTDMLQDHTGTFWVSSNRYHLNRFDRRTMQFHPLLHDPKNLFSINSDCVHSIFEDHKGQLWFGTDKGLDLYDRTTGQFTHFGMKDGLSDLQLGKIEEDNQEQLWIITGNGITRFNPVSRVFRNFDKSDGIHNNEIRDIAKSPTSGTFYLATANGISMFHPDSLRDNPVVPQIVFTKFTRFQSNKYREIEEKGISAKTELVLSYLDDILTFEFAALSFRKSSKNQYAYKLEGFNDQWIPLETKHEISFTNLSPGTYILRVKASNGDGVWNEEGVSLKITVIPPWWATWWAYLIYLFLAVGGIYSVYRFQLKRQLTAAETRRLQELDTFKSQFYTNITHEFRTPLTVIGGMVEQIRENPGKWLEEGLEMIQRNSRSLLRLVNQMLDLSKLESGSLPVHLIHDDVLLYLKYLCESFHSYAESKNIRLQFETELEKCSMDYDPEKMEQIISNLLSNAIRFTPEGGTVTLYAQMPASGNFLEIRVSDTGIGIPEDQLPFVFDRFYQAEHPSEPHHEGGTGIGLALTKELVKLLGGRIEATSTPGKGAAFTVCLPLQQEGIAAIQVARTAPSEKDDQEWLTAPFPSKAELPLLESREGGYHLLLIEDNADVVRYLSTCLGEQYRLSVATDGAKGLAQALEHIPDLIISDVMMPRMDGFELCAALKRDERSSHIPIILLTAKGDMASKLEGLQHGADAYLVKPFNKEELLVSVQNLLELRRSLQAYYLALAAHLSAPAEPNTPTEENAFVLKVRGIVEAHLNDPKLDVEHLCRKVGMSNSNLHRKLTALTGHSANRFIRYIRLSKACILLRDPELTIVAVAYDCGFNDPVYFARAFRQEFGMSPSEWRNTKSD